METSLDIGTLVLKVAETLALVQVRGLSVRRNLPVVIPTVGADGTTTTVAVASLVADGVGITVIAPINVEQSRTVTMVTGDTATRTTVIIHSVRHVMSRAIGTTPLLAQAPGIAVGTNANNVM